MRTNDSFLGLRKGVQRFLGLETERRIQEPRPVGAAAPPSPFVSAGRFGLIGLTEIRDAVGSRWPALEERVRALSEAVISRHLTQGDVFEAQGDDSYVVLFAQLSKEAADFKCRVIGREITQRLLGSDSPRLADVESVSVQVAREALASGDVEAVFAEAFASGEATISSDPSHPRSPDLPIPGRRPHGQAAHPGPQAHEGASTPSGASTGWTSAARLPSGSDLKAERNAGATLVSSHHERPGRIEPVWRYAPVWDFKSMSLVRFRLTARSMDTGAGDATAADAGMLEIDLGTVSKALDDLSQLNAEGRRLLVISVVHQGSLSVQWRRDQLIELVGGASIGVRRLLRLEVAATEFSPTLALAQFLTAMTALEVQCALCVPLGSRTPVRPAGMPLKTAAVEANTRLPESEALTLLNTFSRRSAQVGLESAAHRLDTRSLVIGAVAAGIRFMSGRAVRAEVEDLSQGLRFEPSDLYRDLLLGRPA